MSEDEYNNSVMDVKNLQEITVDQCNLYTNAEQMYPTCPDRLYTPTTSEERDTDDGSHSSQITISSQCLGDQLHNNLATIIDDYDSEDINQIPKLQNTINKEKNIIQRTNDLQEYIFTDDWMQN